jgi:hypothetical protein
MDWPTVAAVKRALGVTVDTRDAEIAAAVGAAIEQVAVDCGYSSIEVTQESAPDGAFSLSAIVPDAEEAAEVVPTFSQSQAALVLAVMVTKAPDAPFGVAAVFDLGGLRVAAEHPTYTRLLTGHRQRFGVA